MALGDALDLGAVDPPVWRIKAGEAVYGPYTLGQMARFAAEGRLAPHSLVSEGEDGLYCAAEDAPALRKALADAQAGAPDPLRKYMLSVHVEGTSSFALTAALNAMGSFIEAAPNVFLVRSTVRLAKVREQVAGALGPLDRAVVADVETGRLAWINLGPEADVQIRALWSRPADAKAG